MAQNDAITTWPQVHPEFEASLRDHMQKEDERDKEEAVRKALLEKQLEDGTKRMELLASELAPIKKLYYATLGCGFVGAALVAMMVWVYTNDRSDTKADRQEFKALAASVYDIASTSKVLLEKQARLQVEQDRLWLLMGIKR